MSNPNVVRAKYVEAAAPEYRNNPLIEALPQRLSTEEFYRVFTRSSWSEDSQRQCSPECRIEFVDSTSFFVPSRLHLDLYQCVHGLLQKSYQHRSPTRPEYWRSVASQVEEVLNPNELAPPRPRLSKALIGFPGTGKSVTALRLGELYPKAISHGIYNDKTINIIQIPIIYVEARKDCSVRDICLQTLAYVDEIAGTKWLSSADRLNIDGLVIAVAKVTRLHAVGVIILDELQELSPSKSGGYNATLSFLLRLANTRINGILFVGTPEAHVFKNEAMRYIRRTSGIPEWRPMEYNTADWRNFVAAMWKCQFTRTPTPLSDALSELLHSLSFGVPDLAIEIYKEVQLTLIQQSRRADLEVITPGLMAKIALLKFEKDIQAMRKIINAEKLGSARKGIPTDAPSEPIEPPRPASKGSKDSVPRTREGRQASLSAEPIPECSDQLSLESIASQDDSSLSPVRLREAGIVRSGMEFFSAKA
jgi:hypothetical protein